MKRTFILAFFLAMIFIVLTACEATNGDDVILEQDEIEAVSEPEATPEPAPEPTPEPLPEPELIPMPKVPFTAIAAGITTSFALDEDGRLWAWGEVMSGRRESSPTLLMENIRYISSSSIRAFAIDNDGGLWGYGTNRGGELGTGTTQPSLDPVLIMGNIVAVAAGHDFQFQMGHTVALDTDGVMWAWGNNRSGQLGDGSNNTSLSPIRIMDNVVAVAAGISHTAALDAEGVVWTWGSNDRGQLGDGVGHGRTLPMPVKDNVQAIAIGSDNTYVITNDNVLWAWGMNAAGQLGNGTNDDQHLPVRIMEDVAHVSAGFGHTLTVTLDGELWTFGNNNRGQLGLGSVDPDWDRWIYPQRAISGIVAAAGGAGHSLALDTYGNLWSWGRNDYGQLGDGSRDDRYNPQRVIYFE